MENFIYGFLTGWFAAILMMFAIDAIRYHWGGPKLPELPPTEKDSSQQSRRTMWGNSK